MKDGMEDLQQLEQTGLYVFHGSSIGALTLLEPHQAMSHGKPDGKPCVAAAERSAPAIFMAVLGSRHVGGWGRGNLARGEYGFYIKAADYKKAKVEKWHGYVYVLPKVSFEHVGAWEWRAFQPVKPTTVIQVGLEDLPAGIAID